MSRYDAERLRTYVERVHPDQPTQQLTVYAHAVVRGLTLDETALVMGISRETVRRHLGILRRKAAMGWRGRRRGRRIVPQSVSRAAVAR